MKQDTICAISTPIGTGGISIVRLSGSEALNIASQLFTSRELDYSKIKPRYMYLGTLKTQDFTEKCMMVYFKAPYSYTGEDLIEFQCHGGVLLTKKVLTALLNKGARLAEGGEFTKRAFVNGKLGLDEAEGVIDIINAESESELKAGYGLVKGNLHTQIEKLQNVITDILSQINVTFDFPENDDEETTADDVLNKLTEANKTLDNIIKTSSTGIKLKTGTNIAIVGKPNVGKSSLLNAMLGIDRAIVTDIQGTTRDTLEETYIYRGVRFNLIDTAGLHESNDVVESIGISKAIETLNNADLVLFVLDNNSPLTEADKNIIKLVSDKKVLVVINKVDLENKLDIKTLPFNNIIKCSALNKSGIDEIKQKIYDMVIDEKILGSNIIITNLRHADALQRAKDIIDNVIVSLTNGCALELTALDLQNAWQVLGEITGQTNNEEIIGNIFKKFCVGK